MSVSPLVHSSKDESSSFEIKSAQLPLVALILKNGDLRVVMAGLLKQYGSAGDSPDFFDQDALVIDFSHLEPDTPVQNLAPLLAVLRSCHLMPVAVRAANTRWLAAARHLGLAEAPADIVRVRSATPLPVLTEVVVQEVIRELVHETVREVAGPATMVVDKPLRSGQKIYARGADLVVLAMVNQGAEVVADGNIHVYAPLRGKAMAGASGNTNARIFSLCLEPELISIAGIYRTSETPLAAEIHGKPAQVRLSQDGQDKLLFEALKT
jgi:septum site-determining protein MinC